MDQRRVLILATSYAASPPSLGPLWLRIVAALAVRSLRSAVTCLLSILNTEGAKGCPQFVNRRSSVQSGSPAPNFNHLSCLFQSQSSQGETGGRASPSPC